MAACTWKFFCPQTGVSSTIIFEPGDTFGAGTWTLLLGGSTYQSTQDSGDISGCREISLTRTAGTDGPMVIDIRGLQTPSQEGAAALNCCNTIGLFQQPNPGNVPTLWTLTISGETGGATCMNIPGPIAGTGGLAPIVVQWLIGHGSPFTSPDTCEGGSSFIIDNIGGCLVLSIGGDTSKISGASSSLPTDDPFTITCTADLTDIVNPGAGSAVFNISVPNPQP
jgi:hypothetical protein